MKLKFVSVLIEIASLRFVKALEESQITSGFKISDLQTINYIACNLEGFIDLQPS